MKYRLWTIKNQIYVNLFGHRNYNRFAVIGNARTGSNYLYLGLKNSNCVRMHHEVFAEHHLEMAGKEFDQIFPMVFQKESRNIKAYGIRFPEYPVLQQCISMGINLQIEVLGQFTHKYLVFGKIRVDQGIFNDGCIVLAQRIEQPDKG